MLKKGQKAASKKMRQTTRRNFTANVIWRQDLADVCHSERRIYISFYMDFG